MTRALILESRERPPVVCSIDLPSPQPGEISVAVARASVNASDVRMARGAVPPRGEPPRLPHGIGREFSGTVVQVGAGVSHVEPGQRVFGMVPGFHLTSGSIAEGLVVAADLTVVQPEGLSDDVAACLPVGGTTALAAVRRVSPIEPGDTIVVRGASGGVGNFTVQLLKAAGARVMAVALPGDEVALRNLGVDEIIDRDQDLAREVRARSEGGVDAAIDLVALTVDSRLVSLVRDGGRVATLARGPEVPEDLGRGITHRSIFSEATRSELAWLASQAAAGELHVLVQRRRTLDEAVQALDEFADEHTLGKTIIETSAA